MLLEAMTHALDTLVLVSLPLLLPVLVVGIMFAMVQAATSINEATLTFVPKLVIFGLALFLFGGTMLVLLGDFTREMFERIPDLVR